MEPVKKAATLVFFWAGLTELIVNMSTVWEMVRIVDARTGLTVIFIVSGVVAGVLYFVEKYRKFENTLANRLRESGDRHDRAIAKFANNMDRYYYQRRSESRALQESIDKLLAALREENHVPHGSKEDASLVELRRDVDIMKRRVVEIDEKLLDLKLKVLEKLGRIPEWWKE